MSGAYEWGVAGRPLEGYQESGDRALIAPHRDGTLVAVIDGLGHGHSAAVAARLAAETLEANLEGDLVELIQSCHRALRHTRGAVVALAVARDDGQVMWTGVGSVEAVAVRADPSGTTTYEHALIPAGLLGMQVPVLRPTDTVLAPGDRVVFATDGIDRSFVDDPMTGTPQQLAEDLLHRHATTRDDALIVVGQYRKASQ